jgi:hypothetical protein
MSLNPTNPRAKPRWLLAAGVVGMLLVVTAGLSYAAVFGSNLAADAPYTFELDRNPQDDAGLGSSDPDTEAVDWANLYVAGTDDLSGAGSLDAVLEHDEVAEDDTYFTGGSSKDDIDIDTTATGGGWLRDATSSAQPKADIQHAFAATYLVDDPTNAAGDPPDTVVYFGLDRFSNDGATFAGFWFLQDDDITYGPTANNGVGEIHGNHVRGDILIVTDFTQGGPVVNFRVYVWTGGTPYPNLGPVINGTFQVLFNGTDCAASNAGALACSTVNDSVVDAVWPFTPKSNVGPAGEYQPGLFLEGGINLSDVFPGNTDPCFSTYVAETRASFSVDSTLSDFTLGGFKTCGSLEVVKYHDLDADGARDVDGNGDPTEAVLEGWDFYIENGADETRDPQVDGPIVTTDANGVADFGDQVVAGEYKICEVLQSTWNNSDPTGDTLCKTVDVGAQGEASLLFGNYQDGTIRIEKYHDLDADGSGPESGEGLLANWPIHIFAVGAGPTYTPVDADSGTAGYQSFKTGAGGTLSVSLMPGTYAICEAADDVAGAPTWIESEPASGTDCAAIDTAVAGVSGLAAKGYTQTIVSGTTYPDATGYFDFGNYQNVTQRVLKYHDLNADGSRDADGVDNTLGNADDEVLLSGWEFFINKNASELWDDGVDSAKQSTAAGETTFTLKPGASYSICEVLQSTWNNSDPVGTTVCESTGVVVSGVALTDMLFGNYQDASKSGVKFHDRDGDGNWEPSGASAGITGDDEIGLSGWTITLTGTDGAGNAVSETRTTDGNGAYSFTGLRPGTYTVCETPQTGWAQTFPVVATPESGACGNGTRGYSIVLTSGENDSGNHFGNRELYRLIVLTCSEASGDLVVSTVDLDGAGTGFVAKDTLADPPTLSGNDLDSLEDYLCGLGGARYTGLTPGTYTGMSAILPKYQ